MDVEEITKYFSDIKYSTPLSASEEAELAKEIQNGNIESRDKLVEANLKFVVSVAKTYRKSWVPFQDLISAGNIGLIKAAERFDYTKGVKFISYAVWWVKNAIMECISSYKTVDVSEYSFEDLNLDDDHDETGSLRFEDINNEFEESISKKQGLNHAVDNLLGKLKEREAKILTLYYGLYGNEEMTLDEIGKEMNLTMERVRQIRDKAMIKVSCAALNSDEFETYKQLYN